MDEWKLEQGSGDGAGVCLARSMVPVLLGAGEIGQEEGWAVFTEP